MSLINRIEVSNFLNLDNVLPHEQNWCAHYPHLILNCGGENTIIQLPNGGGKSTISNAILALLSRNKDCTKRVREILAPKRGSIYTHIRLEVKHNHFDTIQANMIGEMPGEPYVIGLYGYHDSSQEIKFYIYQGELEDCPVAYDGSVNGEIVIDYVSNKNFEEKLKSVRHYKVRSRTEYQNEIHQHFDEKLINQLLQYQKLGGGDGTSNFFKLSSKSSDEFSSDFFYEHLAPEVLVDCMGESGEEDEHAFEDTLIHSSTRVIDIELRQEKAEKEVQGLNNTFDWLDQTCTRIHEYEEQRDQVNRKLSTLWAELEFIHECVATIPLSCIPKLLVDEGQGKSLEIANGLVRYDGSWLISDSLLASCFADLPVHHLNQKCQREKIACKELKDTQLIDLPCDIKVSEGRSKRSGKFYTRENAISLAKRVPESTIPDDVNRDAILRWINYGFDKREAESEFNPFRVIQRQYNEEINQLDEQKQTLQVDIEMLAAQESDLSQKIQHFEANESAFFKIIDSGLFTPQQIENLSILEEVLEGEDNQLQSHLTALNQKNTDLEQGRKAYEKAVGFFGANVNPKQKNDELEQEKNNSNEQYNTLLHQSKTLDLTISNNQSALEVTREKKQTLIEQHGMLNELKGTFDELKRIFSENEIIGLPQRLQQELGDCRSRENNLSKRVDFLKESIDKMLPLSKSYKTYQEVFAGLCAIGLRHTLEMEQSQLQQKRKQIAIDAKRINGEKENLNLLQKSYINVKKIYGGKDVPLQRLEVHLNNEQAALQRKHSSLSAVITDNQDLIEALLQYKTLNFSSIDVAMLEHEESLLYYEDCVHKLSSSIAVVAPQLAVLRSGKIAPLSLSQQAIERVGYEGVFVGEFIKNLELDSEKKRKLLNCFSQLLHAPVVDSRSQAELLVKQLYEAELDYPVFDKEGLTTLCNENIEHIENLFVGVETIQVKAILDPSCIPTLISKLEGRLADLQIQLNDAREKKAIYQHDGKAYQFLCNVKKAIDSDVLAKVDTAKAQLQKIDDEINQLHSLLKAEEFNDIGGAILYEKLGGDAFLTKLENESSSLDDLLIDTSNRLEELEPLLSQKGKELIQDAELFEQLGGSELLNEYQHELLVEAENLMVASENYQRAQNDFGNHFNAAQKAEKFLIDGGEEKLLELASRLDQINIEYFKIEGLLGLSKSALSEVKHHLEIALSQKQKTFERVAQWADVLLVAQFYIDAQGIEFDKNYNIILEELREKSKNIRKQLKFNFQDAQLYLDALSENLGRDEMLDSLGKCKGLLKDKRIRIDENRNRTSEIKSILIPLQTKIQEHDQCTKDLLQKYQISRPIFLSISTLERVNLVEENTYLQSAKLYANEYRRACSIKEWEEAAERLGDLVDIMRYFKFEEEHKEAHRLSNNILRELKQIEGSISKNAEEDAGLRPGEKSELVGKGGESLFLVTRQLKSAYENLCIDAEKKLESLRKDVNQQHTNLSDSLIALSSNIQDNFELMCKVLKRGSGRAGFTIEAEIIDKIGIRDRIEGLIEGIKTKEVERRKIKIDALKHGHYMESDQTYMKGLKMFVRESFYRSVFKGKKDEPMPRVYFEHPCLANGNRKELSNKFSTGQQAALSLLLLTKLAQFASERDKHSGLISMSRRKKGLSKTSNNKVVLIDGLFSNLSDKELIRFSLETVKLIKDQFQLIGWVHNPEYRNDHSIFPRFYNVQRVDSRGYITATDRSQGNKEKSLMAAAGLFAHEVGI